MFRYVLILPAVTILLGGSWATFIKPANEIIAGKDQFPSSLTAKVITEEKIFPKKENINGRMLVIEDEGKETVIRLEEFVYHRDIPVCPNLRVLLVYDNDPNKSLDLGRLTMTEGNANYLVPKNIKYYDYTQMQLWCETFGSTYASAELFEKEKRGLFIR